MLNVGQFPVSDKNRKSTDIVCTFISAAVALTLFILACVFWNKGIFVLTQESSKINSSM